MATASTTNAPNKDATNDLLETCDLSLQSVYKYYPKEFLPKKLSKSSSLKAKELKFEHIEDNTYEPQANMVAFKVPAQKIAPYIKGLSISYYDIYGKIDNFQVNLNENQSNDESDVNETTSDTNSDLNETIVAKDDTKLKPQLPSEQSVETVLTIDQNNNKPHEMNKDTHGEKTRHNINP
ncbi:unnamed protein product [Mytilus coruscus]|uniref:Uncharacterized protein n=1 Tax=Mytilus coruscus TaxID=42192 RepID=A0A6J8DTL0_MYTCO|nr:unnamed protein product [Mytilus coruscus]